MVLRLDRNWCFPAALGMFSNPVACHQIAEAADIPRLVLVLNNSEWGAVRQCVLGVYPNGYAAKSNDMPLVSLSPSLGFTSVASASRAWRAKVAGRDAVSTRGTSPSAHSLGDNPTGEWSS
jgi:acetolactate synthase-1/2/3 large subunit